MSDKTTIELEKSTRNKLMILKFENNLKTINEVIDVLIKKGEVK